MGTIMRLNPYQIWEIDAIEGWLDDMASQGYLLESRKGGYFVFQETEPQKARHRIDVRENQYENTKKRQEAYREFGWEYISPLDTRLDIYRATREDAVELNTDEDLLRQTLEKSQRALKRTIVFGNLFVLALLIAVVFVVCKEGFFHVLLTRSALSSPVMLLWFAIILLEVIRSIRAYRAIKQRSLLERSYHTREREAKGRKAVRWNSALHWIILILLFLNLILDQDGVRESAEIKGSPFEAYSIQMFLPEDGADDEREWAFSYPRALCTQHDFGQYTSSGERDYDVTIYETRWPWLAKGYAREIARIANAEEISADGHESAWYYVGTPPLYLQDIYSRYRTDSWQNLILLKDNLVIEISYEGSADLKAAAQK